MSYGITHATVIGAGTMGAAIAGHLANAGIPVHLLDIVPERLTEEEEKKGLTLEDRSVRNRIGRQGFERMVNARPANLFTREKVDLISLGNVTDDLATAVGQSDWIIEAIVEQIEPKQALMAQLEEIAPSDAIVTTNTSGIPIQIISRGRDDAFKKRFFGTHFFNPPRYLHLLEIVPTADTDLTLVARMKEFAEQRLGKGVVICKDTPNFIANRMFSIIQGDLMEFAIENDYTVEEVDRLTGPLIGRPKTGTFRLSDVIGVDIMAMVAENLYEMIPDDEDREILRGERSVAVMETLIQHGLLGGKSEQGFYKRVDGDDGKEFWGLDLQAPAGGEIDYIPPEKPTWTSVGEARGMPLPKRLRHLIRADDRAAVLLWHTLARTFSYASKRIPEIADSIVDIDNAMKWGFGWELGPFEMWGALGVEETVARMEGDGFTVAEWVHELIQSGGDRFYTFEDGKWVVYSPISHSFEPAATDPNAVSVEDLTRTRDVLVENEAASLIDMGDGVMLLAFHTKMNSLDLEIIKILTEAVDRLHGDASGLVIGNQGQNFSVGANLLLIGKLAQSEQWDQLENTIGSLQEAIMSARMAPAPVVAAPFQMTLGGGCEVAMGADRIVAHAETYMGLVEVGVGLIPAGTGCKEMVRRNVNPHIHADNVHPAPYLQQIFQTIGYSKVTESAEQARDLGFFTAGDRVVMNSEHLLAEAKREVLRMVDDGYTAPIGRGNVYAAGADILANLRIGTHSLREAGRISGHDANIAGKLAYVLCGGELSQPAWMDEAYFLDLEREAFLSLCGETKTQERIWYMLQKGKPLRN